jgi:diguanylate cyclase (GGDEF)-like protein
MSVFDINNLPKNQEEVLNKPLVMLVDDEIENIKVLQQLLISDFEVITGLNATEALDYINKMEDPKDIQLIISDQRMPGITGVEFLEKVVNKMPDTIRIILTGYSDTQAIIDSINKAKLYKFMTKPFDPAELSLTVQRGIEAFQMRKDLVDHTNNLEHKVVERTKELAFKNNALTDALNKLEKLSVTDLLTGTNNRRFLGKFMQQELAQLKRQLFQSEDQHYNLGFLMIDIDHFKYINDTYGHDAGDKVLVQFSDILKKTCRESDCIVRWGGEEFVILVRFSEQSELQHLSERIRSNVEDFSFDLGNQKSINRTCSIGMCTYPFIKNHLDAITWQQTLNLADIAMYLAKDNGRNAWVSLFENNVTESALFYQQAIDNINQLLLEKTLSCKTSTTINIFSH